MPKKNVKAKVNSFRNPPAKKMMTRSVSCPETKPDFRIGGQTTTQTQTLTIIAEEEKAEKRALLNEDDLEEIKDCVRVCESLISEPRLLMVVAVQKGKNTQVKVIPRIINGREEEFRTDVNFACFIVIYFGSSVSFIIFIHCRFMVTVTMLSFKTFYSNNLIFSLQSQWMTALEKLDLRLEEVIHIRSVLTKAELESLPLDGTLKVDVEQGKICFLCMKTRFGLFTWGVRCQLCHQQVCSKCSKKMHIPTDHFSSVDPSILSKDNKSKIRPKINQTSSSVVGSAPNSPDSKRKSQATGLTAPNTATAAAGPVSLPANIAVQQQKSRDNIQGPLLQVCTDCRQMVLEVIRAKTTARRFQLTKALFSKNEPKEEVF